MKSTALFFILSLLSSVFALSSEFKDIESTKLGKNLMDMIQIQLSSKEPVQTLLNMLNEMSDNLAHEQEAADQTHKNFQDECDADISFFNFEIEESASRVEKANQQLISLRPQLSTAEDNLATQKTNLQGFEEQLNQATRQRQTEAEEYNLKVQEHEQALSVLHEVAGLFQGLVSTNSAFLQKNNGVFTQVSSTIKASVSKIKKGYRGIFMLLAQIAEKAPTQANQATVSKILDLIRKIKENVQASQDIEREAENQRITAFNELSDSLNSSITQTRAAINDLNNKIENLKASIAGQEEEVKTQTERNNLRKTELADKTKACKDESDAYANDRTKRTEERNIVNQVLDVINTKLANLRQYIKERVQKVE